MASTTTTKINITLTAPTVTGRRTEIWEAESTCGTWHYNRTEESGTPWVVTHIPTGHTRYFGSLPKARRWTAQGDSALVAEFRRLLIASRGSWDAFKSRTELGGDFYTPDELVERLRSLVPRIAHLI